MKNIIDLISGYRAISIIGMEKNVGKTTTLNYVLGEAKGKLTLGITSIGRDGEEVDVVTSTDKPKIYVEKGTIIATAKEALFNCDITREILNTTGITTPMGEVIVVRALSDGYIDLAGPSLSKYIGDTCDEIINLGCDLVLVDGALGRKSFAAPSVTEAAILATGASLNRSMKKVVERTIHTINMLTMDKLHDERIRSVYINQLKNTKVALIHRDYSVKKLNIQTTMKCGSELKKYICEDIAYVLIKGVLSDDLIEMLIKERNKVKNITLVIEDGTKIFAGIETMDKFNRIGGKVRLINDIHIPFITINPVSPYGYEFNKESFMNALKEKTDIPILNVLDLTNNKNRGVSNEISR